MWVSPVLWPVVPSDDCTANNALRWHLLRVQNAVTVHVRNDGHDGDGDNREHERDETHTHLAKFKDQRCCPGGHERQARPTPLASNSVEVRPIRCVLLTSCS